MIEPLFAQTYTRFGLKLNCTDFSIEIFGQVELPSYFRVPLTTELISAEDDDAHHFDEDL